MPLAVGSDVRLARRVLPRDPRRAHPHRSGPTSCRLGGITPLLKVAAVAEAYQVAVSPVRMPEVGVHLACGLGVGAARRFGVVVRGRVRRRPEDRGREDRAAGGAGTGADGERSRGEVARCAYESSTRSGYGLAFQSYHLLSCRTVTPSHGGATMPSDPEKRIQELHLTLPPAPKPVAVYKTAVKVGNMLYVSGHGPLKADKTMITGRRRAGHDPRPGQGRGPAGRAGDPRHGQATCSARSTR